MTRMGIGLSGLLNLGGKNLTLNAEWIYIQSFLTFYTIDRGEGIFMLSYY